MDQDKYKGPDRRKALPVRSALYIGPVLAIVAIVAWASSHTVTNNPTPGTSPTPTAISKVTPTPTPAFGGLPTRTRTPVAVATNTVTAGLPWLKTMNGKIVRADNNAAVELRGVNLLRYEWVSNMTWEEASFPVLASTYHVNLITHGIASNPVVANNAPYMAALDEYQRLAEANGMYCIFAYYYADQNGDQPPRADLDPNAQRALVMLEQRYRTKSNVMFMLEAEPHSDTYQGTYYRIIFPDLVPMYNTMITAMRAVDNPSPHKHLILASGDGYGRDISPVVVDEYGVGHLSPITADNAEGIVYSSHPYDDRASSNDWSYFLPVARAGYPVLVTEFGTGTQQSEAGVETLVSEMNNSGLHIGWTAWIWDGEGCPCLTQHPGDMTLSVPYGAFIMNTIQQQATRFP